MNKPRTCISLALLAMLVASCKSSTPEAPQTYTIGCVASDLVTAINHANADPGPGVINLFPDCEYLFTSANNTQNIDGIDIASALPPVTSDIKLVGNNAVLTTNLSLGTSGPVFGFFLVQNDGFLRAEHLTMKNGVRPLGGAVYIDRARAFFHSTVFHGNMAEGASPSTLAKGGAIYNRGGALSVTGKSQFTGNIAYNNFLEPDLDAYGGGIFNSNGSLIVNNSTFDGNASEFGGAIGSQESAETQGGIGVIIAGSAFLDNQATFDGGAIVAEGERTLFFISGSDFTENSASGRAGAIQIKDSVLDLGFSTFTGNTSDDCGAVENAQGSELILSGSDFNGNSTTGSGGGLCHSGDSLKVSNSHFQSNQAAGWGGGIFIDAFTTSIDNSTFSENTAYKGGGLYAGHLPGALTGPAISVEIRRSTFNANQAIGYVEEENPWNPAGGGIAFSGKELTIDQSTLWGNRSLKGAGIYAYQGILNIVNSTISGNDGHGLYLDSSTNLDMNFTTILDNHGNYSLKLYGTAQIQNSIVRGEGSVDCNFSGAGPFNMIGANLDRDGSCGFSLSSLSMGLGLIADNGGPTYTHAVNWSGSPAYDAGDCHGVTVDQRGESRPKGAACDLGSFELDYVPNPPLPPDSPTPSPTSSRCEYTAKVNASCRAGDDTRTQLIKVLTQGDMLELLSLNPELTHGLFALPDGRSCWVWLPFMEGPADPMKNCNVPINNPPDYIPGGPACSADLPKAQCEAAGGTMSGASSSASKCICPSAASVTDPSTGPQSLACAGTGDRVKDPSSGLESLTRKFSILWPI